MNRPSDAATAYSEQAIRTATPVGLVRRVLDRLILESERAMTAFDNGTDDAAQDHLERASRILVELRAAIDPDRGADLAIELDRLYEFCGERVQRAKVEHDPELVRDVITVAEPLAEAFGALPE